MSQRWKILIAAAVAVLAVLIFAIAAGITYVGARQTPAAAPAPPPAPPETAPVSSPVGTLTPTPTRRPTVAVTYPIINRDGGPVSAPMRDQIAAVDAYVRLRYTRTTDQPYPGVDRGQLAQVATGQAREAVEAELAAGPDQATYEQARAEGFTQNVTIVDAYLDETGRDPIVVNIEVRDSNTVATEGSYKATVAPCGLQLCVATFERFSTE
ncbi:hypothetical protein CGZ98_06095 [Enemella evansiae]|uniref:hypothetical protein n=1 Tax=Enemella evansiae TaxID=2016499 RepID=UPI000B969803|nr:hypothetical protein [Enemella evansiae]OYO13113.1 hypothetical protein CGZ98_06095 [Enemella evansiae]